MQSAQLSFVSPRPGSHLPSLSHGIGGGATWQSVGQVAGVSGATQLPLPQTSIGGGGCGGTGGLW